MFPKITVWIKPFRRQWKGNWISRSSEMMGQAIEQTRTIEYYE